ncbi:MAG: SURF1 family protein [Acidimicrobiia bacterium]|nr:SURF1 family protein [Acidimicrobiia bacterium]
MSSPLLKPRWLIGHVLVVAFTVLFLVLGFWQLGRHFDQRERNEVVADQIAAPPVELPAPGTVDDSFELQTVYATGRYDVSGLLERRPRVVNGRAGYDQIVPLVTDTGTVLVNRGFIADADGPGPGALSGRRVTVTGTIRLDQGTSRFGPQNPESGLLETIARIDLERLAEQFDRPLYRVYLDLVAEEPPAGGPDTLLPEPPSPTTRPHLPYAVQWWAFAGVVTVGWFLYLRKQFFTA